ncbi:MAG: hypothetical protein CMJ90_19720, partial [Planctomycetes bacterium]|nr:hypothetical protein [Planctomycetota bacterium]
MYEMFNAPVYSNNKDGYYELQTHANGGFCIKIKKQLARFQISKALSDRLGLKTSITTIGRGGMDVEGQIQTNWILMRTIEINEYDRGF